MARDNQWWYSRHLGRKELDHVVHLVVAVGGCRCQMTHSAIGRDGRITRSFRFDNQADRDNWVTLRGQHVLIEILNQGRATIGIDDAGVSREDSHAVVERSVPT